MKGRQDPKNQNISDGLSQDYLHSKPEASCGSEIAATQICGALISWAGNPVMGKSPNSGPKLPQMSRTFWFGRIWKGVNYQCLVVLLDPNTIYLHVFLSL